MIIERPTQKYNEVVKQPNEQSLLEKVHIKHKEPTLLSSIKTQTEEPTLLSSIKTQTEEPTLLSSIKTQTEEPILLSRVKTKNEEPTLNFENLYPNKSEISNIINPDLNKKDFFTNAYDYDSEYESLGKYNEKLPDIFMSKNYSPFEHYSESFNLDKKENEKSLTKYFENESDTTNNTKDNVLNKLTINSG